MTYKIKYLVAHRPGRSPGQRFRFEQYIGYLKQNGFEPHISYLINERDDTIFYANGSYLSKFLFLLKSLWKRWQDVRTAGNFDIIFIYREAHMLGLTWFERKLRKLNKKIVLDFDDSIWLHDVSNGNRKLAFLKKPSKTNKIIALADLCIVGNRYLAEYAKQFNKNVIVIPTTVDTKVYPPHKINSKTNKVIIGWTGSSTTLRHFSLAVPVLQALREKYGQKIGFKVISDEPYNGQLEGLEFIRWNIATEVSDLQRIDIGIMPLPDDPWARGKCGFKGLQYMALGIPAVMSPVGVNAEIIIHGRNGFLAQHHNEWTGILSMLVEDPNLRDSIGKEGRKTVEKEYSYESQKEKYVKVFSELMSAKI